MSFLKRLFGGGATRQLDVNATFFPRTRDDAAVEVVGEAYRQQNVIAARPPGPEDLPPGLPAPSTGYYKAMLVPEPTNEYDRNAISVLVWAGQTWSMCGYLSRFDAERYQPLFRHLAGSNPQSSPAIACDAALKSERAGTGVVLHLGTPGECVAELATEDAGPATHQWVAKYVVFTGQGGTTIFGVPLEREAQVFLARWGGCHVLPRLTKKTDLLVVSDGEQVTGNRMKAAEYGIEAVDEVTFLGAIGVPTDAMSRVTGRWARA